jgi:hypothetical protein
LLAVAVALLGIGFFARTPDAGGVALRDFEAYYAAGSTWHYHGDPYGREIWRAERTIPGVVATRDELLPFVGPPFSLPLWDALSRLPWVWAAGVWHVVMLASFATVVLAGLRIAAGKLVAFDACAALVMGATFAPLTSGAALGQVALPACAAVVAMPVLLRLRFGYAAAFGGLVAALQPNLALALVARLREPRSWIGAAAAFAIALGGSIVAMEGLGGIGHYLAVLHDHAYAERDAAIQTTLAGVLRGFGANSVVAGTVAAIVALAIVAALAVQCLSRRYAPDACLVLACAALPLALPFAHEHDFTLAFFPAIVVARRARGWAWSLGGLAALTIAVDWLGLAQRSNAIASAALLAAAAAFALAALARGPLRPLHFLPLAIVPAVALAGLAAGAHPLPTWPDNLPAHFNVPATLPAAEVWRVEQLASGVAALDWHWALLRAFSLAGCALLWGVASYVLLSAPETEPSSVPSSIPLGRPQAAHPSA